MEKLFKRISLTLASIIIFSMSVFSASEILVFQSDFGLKDGAVSAMKGVATGID